MRCIGSLGIGNGGAPIMNTSLDVIAGTNREEEDIPLTQLVWFAAVNSLCMTAMPDGNGCHTEESL